MSSNRVRVWKRLGMALAVLSMLVGSVETWRDWNGLQSYAALVERIEADALNYELACAVKAPDADYPACSMSREARVTGRRNLATLQAAFRWNPLIVVALPLIVLGVFWTAAWIATGRWRT